MITKNSVIFVFLIALFAGAYGMDQEVGSVGRSCAAAQADGHAAISSSSRVERAHPRRKINKMALSFLLNPSKKTLSESGSSSNPTITVAAPGSFSQFRLDRPASHWCPVCDFSHYCITEYGDHIRAGHKNYLFSCAVCNKLLPHKEYLDHMQDHGSVSENGVITCFCGKVFKTRSAFCDHVLRKKHVELTAILAKTILVE